MIAKDHRIFKLFAISFFGFIVSNILYLDYLIFKNKTNIELLQIASQSTDKGSQSVSVCEGKDCLDKI